MTDINEKDFEKIETEDLNYYLLENMKEMTGEESEIRDNTLFIPEYSLSIRPQTAKSDSNMAVINYYLYSENWDREIFECSASMGENRKQALSLAEQGFIFGIMSGIKYMMKNEFFKEIKTEFNGPHSWKMYSSDIVAMGDVPDTINPKEIWGIIENEIPKYLGNQKISYIKVFAAKNKNDITKVKTKEAYGENSSTEEWEYQFAWDKENAAVTTLSKAMQTLFNMIKQYDEMVHKNWDLVTEEQKLRIEVLKEKLNKDDISGINNRVQIVDDIDD